MTFVVFMSQFFLTLGTSCRSPSCLLIQYLLILGPSSNTTNSVCVGFFLFVSKTFHHMMTYGSIKCVNVQFKM